MTRKPALGLFITGNNTGVGKTYVAALIARELVTAGNRVGVYKPAASGCTVREGRLISDDAVALWEAAGCPGELERVCPQRFAAPLAPYLAARAEGRELDSELLRRGIEYWQACSDVILVEGAGGLMSPLSEDEYVADVAYELGYPLIVVARNSLGVINQTLQTLITAATFRHGLKVAGVVLNRTGIDPNDASLSTNRGELEARCVPPILAEVQYQAITFDRQLNWMTLAELQVAANT